MSRLFYLTALLPLAIGIAIGGVAIAGLLADIEEMPRLVAPGAKELPLPAGEYVIYGEAKSKVDGVVYANDSFSVSCGLADRDGTKIELRTPSGNMRYSLGAYSGGNMFEFSLPSATTVRLDCQTKDNERVVLAVGGAIGMRIVMSVIAVVGGLVSAVITFFVIRKKRKRYLALVAARDNAPAT